RVSILNRGVMIREGDVASLTQQRGIFLLALAPGQKFPHDELRSKGYDASERADYWEVQLTDGQSIDPVVDLLRSRNLSLRHLSEKRQSLEDLFIKTVGQ